MYELDDNEVTEIIARIPEEPTKSIEALRQIELIVLKSHIHALNLLP